jgi:hypothetical protein
LEWFAKRHGRLRFKCGDDADGNRVEIDMATFQHYCATQQDDVPLYVFDEDFGADDHPTHEMLDDFVVPPYFEEV